MTLYTAELLTDAEYAYEEIEAETPAQAMRIVRERLQRDKFAFAWMNYEGLHPIAEISIRDEKLDGLAYWVEPDELLAQSAPDLLIALEQALAALKTVPRFRVPSLGENIDSDEIAAVCEGVIAKAGIEFLRGDAGGRGEGVRLARSDL